MIKSVLMIKANRYAYFLMCVICMITSLFAKENVISNAADIADLTFRQNGAGRHFNLLATVVLPATQKSSALVVKDAPRAGSLPAESTPIARGNMAIKKCS